MKKVIIFISLLVIIFIGYLYLDEIQSIFADKDSRTFYSGSVLIEKTSIIKIIDDLEAVGCIDIESVVNEKSKNFSCRFKEQDNSTLDVYPRGMGWGPISFTISNGEIIFADKDITGLPDIEKYKTEVREDINIVGTNTIIIREDTWQLEETRYPWNVVY